MDNYSSFDYLCNEPFFIEGIGNIKCPTLRDIRRISYRMFVVYLSMLTVSVDNYIKLYKLEDSLSTISLEDRKQLCLYDLLLFHNPHLLKCLISFFTCENISFDRENMSFLINNSSSETSCVNLINKDNFEKFRVEVQCVMGIKQPEDKEPKFTSDYGREMYEKLQQNKQKNNINKNNTNEDHCLDNMIKKYCTHNKVGINILNVWDMTYYQFITMFTEYCNGRQCDINDMMAANTFSYKKSSDYKPGDYMKKL